MVAAASMLLAGSAFAATTKEVKAPGAFAAKVHTVAPKTADHITGRVTAMTGTSFSVSLLARKDMKTGVMIASVVYTVNTSSTTTYSMGKTAAKLSNVAVGETVIVSGTLDKTTSTIAATSVKITPAQVKKAAVAKKAMAPKKMKAPATTK